jgi:hypothetical protein
MIPIQEIAKKYGHPMAIVVQCCRVYFKTATMDELNELIGDAEVEWTYLAVLTKHHRIRPIVFNVLLQSKIDLSLKAKLREDLLHQTFLSNKKAKETERIVLLLKQHGILAIPYKGECYSKQFFGEIALRESSDIDFAIESKDIEAVIKVLKKDGYYPNWEEYYNYIGHSAYVKKEKGFDFLKYDGDNKFGVEFHWRKVQSFSTNNVISNKYQFKNLEKITLVQDEILTFNKRYHFNAIYAHHNLADGLAYLKTCVDLAKGILDIKEDGLEYGELFNLDLVTNINNDLFGISTSKQVKYNSLTSIYTNFILSGTPNKANNGKFTFIDYLKRHVAVIRMKRVFYGGVANVFQYYAKSMLRVINWDAYDYYQIKLDKKLKFLYPIIRPFRKILMPTNHNKVALKIKEKAEMLAKEIKPTS